MKPSVSKIFGDKFNPEVRCAVGDDDSFQICASGKCTELMAFKIDTKSKSFVKHKKLLDRPGLIFHITKTYDYVVASPDEGSVTADNSVIQELSTIIDGSSPDKGSVSADNSFIQKLFTFIDGSSPDKDYPTVDCSIREIDSTIWTSSSLYEDLERYDSDTSSKVLCLAVDESLLDSRGLACLAVTFCIVLNGGAETVRSRDLICRKASIMSGDTCFYLRNSEFEHADKVYEYAFQMLKKYDSTAFEEPSFMICPSPDIFFICRLLRVRYFGKEILASVENYIKHTAPYVRIRKGSLILVLDKEQPAQVDKRLIWIPQQMNYLISDLKDRKMLVPVDDSQLRSCVSFVSEKATEISDIRYKIYRLCEDVVCNSENRAGVFINGGLNLPFEQCWTYEDTHFYYSTRKETNGLSGSVFLYQLWDQQIVQLCYGSRIDGLIGRSAEQKQYLKELTGQKRLKKIHGGYMLMEDMFFSSCAQAASFICANATDKKDLFVKNTLKLPYL